MKTQSSRFLFTLTLALWFGVAASGQAEEKIRGLLHNEDCTDFFKHRPLPAGRFEETLDRYLDVLAGDGRDKIEIAASNGEAFRLTRVEIRFAPPE